MATVTIRPRTYTLETTKDFDADYGFNLDMHIDENQVTVFACTTYCGWYYKTLVKKEYKDISTVFEAVYEALTEVQGKCERLHEGC